MDMGKLSIAYNLGATAFKKGKKRVPVFDKDLLETCLKGCQVGEGIPYVKAWLSGWDDTNLRG